MESTNNGKVKKETTLNGTVYTVPSRKNYFLLVFVTVWLFGWLAALVMVSGGILGDTFSDTMPSLFMVVWVAIWAIGGLFPMSFLLLGYFGKKIITLRGQSFKFSCSVLGFTTGGHL